MSGEPACGGIKIAWVECQQPRESSKQASKQQKRSSNKPAERLFGSVRSGRSGNETPMKRYSPPRRMGEKAPAGQAIIEDQVLLRT